MSASFGLLWAAAIATGFSALLDFDGNPGEAGRPPDDWPSDSTLTRDPALPTLIMVLHPHCPCSRASLAELERILARSRGRVRAHVLLYSPTAAGAAWTDTGTRHRAASIPGVVLLMDADGVEQDRFGLRTSGHVLYYDAAGALRFSGGITAARGHEGDSPGARAILLLLHERAAGGSQAPVYGCPLHASHEQAACARN